MKNKYLVTIAALFGLQSVSAQADLIAYDFVGTNAVWSMTGVVALEEADVVAGENLVDDFVSWSFSWTDGIDTFSNTSSDSTFISDSFFRVDPLGSILSFFLCTNSCGETDTSLVIERTDWDGTLGPGGMSVPGDCCVSSFGQPFTQTSGPRVVSVPEPGILTLLSLGLLGLAIARRKPA